MRDFARRILLHPVAAASARHPSCKPTRRLRPGDSFVVARGVAHNGVNLGKEPARLVLTYMVDKDAPLRTSVPAPHAH